MGKQVAIPWVGTFRSLMEYWVSYVPGFFTEKNYEKVLTSCSVMFEYGKIGSDLYDMIALTIVPTEKNKKLLVGKIEEFVSETSVVDFCRNIRHIIYSDRFVDSDAISSLMCLGTLILTGYNRGSFKGIVNNTGIFDDTPSILEYELILICYLYENKGKSGLHEKIRLSPKKLDKFRSYVQRKDSLGVFKILKELAVSTIVSLFNNCIASLRYAYFCQVFLEQSGCVIGSEIYSYASWEREATVKSTQSVAVSLHGFLFTTKFTEDDLLKKRNVYVRDKGVRLRFKNKIDNIETITLKEYHNFDPYEEHLLLVSYETTGGVVRSIPIDLTSLNSSFVPLMYELDVVVMNLVFKWLGVADKLDLSEERFETLVDDTEGLRKGCIDFLKAFDEFVKEDNIIYEEPVQWNYGKPVSGDNSKTKNSSYIIEKKHIGRYTRKLPVGQKASPEAIALAKKVFMELEEGKTLVDEFERNQRITIGKAKSF